MTGWIEQSFDANSMRHTRLDYKSRSRLELPNAAHLQDLLVRSNDAKANPGMLPPYDGLPTQTCECGY